MFQLVQESDRYEDKEYTDSLSRVTEVESTSERHVSIRMVWLHTRRHHGIHHHGGSHTNRNHTDVTTEWNITSRGNNESVSEIFSVSVDELSSCAQDLRIFRSQEPRLAYTCFQWSREPSVILWTLATFLAFTFVVWPVIVTVIYILALQGRHTTGFIFNMSRGLQYIKRKESLRGGALALFVVFSLVSLVCLVVISYYFTHLGFIMSRDGTGHVLFINRGIKCWRTWPS